MLKKILWGLLAVFAILQCFRMDKSVPVSDPAADFMRVTKPPGEIMSLLRIACYDCHSYQTEYPWYANIAPVSWWIGYHIKDARDDVNFSIWGTYESKDQLERLHACAEDVEDGEMPMPAYTWMHGAAKLSEYQRNLLKSWFNSGQIGMNAQ